MNNSFKITYVYLSDIYKNTFLTYAEVLLR